MRQDKKKKNKQEKITKTKKIQNKTWKKQTMWLICVHAHELNYIK